MEVTAPLSLRDRRRSQLRAQLSDTATAMFLQQGFDAVTVAEVARACGVTEKTVFNHFPTKQSLLIDRWPDITTGLAERIADTSRTTLDAVVQTLDTELDALTLRGTASAEHMAGVRGFGLMIGSTASLRDHRRRALDQLTEVLFAALAGRGDLPRSEVELRVTAVALSGLFQVFYRSLASYLNGPTATAGECRRRVRADIRRAARLLRNGLPG